MTIKEENKRSAVTLCPDQQAQLKRLSKKYDVSESRILARGFDLLVEQERAHFDVGLKKCLHYSKK